MTGQRVSRCAFLGDAVDVIEHHTDRRPDLDCAESAVLDEPVDLVDGQAEQGCSLALRGKDWLDGALAQLGPPWCWFT